MALRLVRVALCHQSTWQKYLSGSKCSGAGFIKPQMTKLSFGEIYGLVNEYRKWFILLILIFHELVYPCLKIFLTGKKGSHIQCR